VLAPPDRHYHFPEALQPAFLETFPLPIGHNRPPDQQIVFPTEDGFERHYSGIDAAAAYANNQRGLIFEDTARRDRGWQWRTIQYLMPLFRHEVVFSFFESTEGDAGLGPHTDDWHNVAVQFYGEKAWWVGADAYKQDIEPTLVLKPGDVLVLPRRYPHNVLSLYGRSVHLAIETRLDRPVPLAK